MDDVIVRSRYPRRNVQNRKRRRTTRTNNTLFEKVVRQTLVCVLILLFFGIIKNTNNFIANFLFNKTKWIIERNIEFKGIYSQIDNFINNVTNSSNLKKEDTDTVENPEESGETAIPASTDALSKGDSDTEKVDSVVSSEKDTQKEVQTGETQKKDVQKGSRGNAAEENKDATDNGISLENSDAIKYNFITPVSGVVSESFGERINPIRKTVEFHKGIDIEANKGAAIKAIQAGEVLEAGREPTYGNYIRIGHSGGFSTLYAHCSALNIKKGQKVKQGDIIAKVGDTGLAVGAHLHFEIWKDGKPVDPLLYIKVQEK